MKKSAIIMLFIMALGVDLMAQTVAMNPANKRYGYKNSDGSWKIAPIYQRAFDFQGSDLRFAVVKLDDKWGCVDVNGNLFARNVFPTREAAQQAGESWSRKEELGRWSYPASNAADGKWGFVNYYGLWAHAPLFEKAGVYIGKEPKNFAAVRQNGRWGCVDGKGSLIITPIFFTQEEAEDAGMQWIYGMNYDTWRYPVTDPSTGMWGFVDYRGQWVTRPRYTDHGYFGDDNTYRYAQVCSLRGRWGNIDRGGNRVTENLFFTQKEAAYALSQLEHGRKITDWRYPIQDPSTEKWGWVDYAGTWVIGPIYDDVTHFANDTGNYATAKVNGFWCVVSNTGKEISQAVFLLESDAHEAGRNWDEEVEIGHWLCPVKDLGNNHWGYVDYSGKWVIQPTFEDAKPFSYTWNNRVAPAMVAGKWGCIDHTGRFVVDNIYNTSADAQIAGRQWAEKHKF